MAFDLEQSQDILTRTPRVLNALLLQIPDEWGKQNEGPDTWSAYDVVGHLIHGEETDWIARAQIILEHGESKPFDVFDRLAQFEKSRGKSLAELLLRFEELRAKNLRKLASWKLTEAQLEKKGTHPDFGVVTLRQLLATWVVHDLSHVAQITRVMCKQYREDVGPWSAYLPILTR